MMRKRTIGGVMAALVLSAACVSGLSASAHTADDVAAKAREAGWPEYLIQAGYNQWASGNYSQEKLEAAYESVSEYDEDTEEMVCNLLGIDPPEEREEPAAPTEPADPSAPMMLTKADGSVVERISPADFIRMSMEEKQAYVDSLSAESKQAFVDSLTPAERNSMLKQLPTDQKAELIQKYVDAANDMGLNVTVDSLDSGISMTIRDEDGIVVDKTAVGNVIDETGISHTKPLAAAAGGALLAVLGFAGLHHYIKRTEE